VYTIQEYSCSQLHNLFIMPLSFRISAFLAMWTVLCDVPVAAQFEGFGGGQAKFCKPYLCGKGQEPVQKWPLSFKSAGCSSLGGMAILSAKTEEDKDSDEVEQCCDLRNTCLQTCGTIKTLCDEEFTKCSDDVCAKADDPEDCKKSTSIHKLMIQMSSCQAYDSEQYSHCECVPKEDAPKRRQDVLRKFYKKFSPDSLDKVEGLAKKADTPRKMATLMQKLVKKYYPETVKKIKDPQQEMMERMVKVSREKDSKQKDDDENENEKEDVQEL
jgi:hypothetical protein